MKELAKVGVHFTPTIIWVLARKPIRTWSWAHFMGEWASAHVPQLACEKHWSGLGQEGLCDSWGSSTLPHAVPGRPQIFQEAHLIQNASPNLRPFFQDPEGWWLRTSFSPSSCLSSPLRENPVRFINSCPQRFSSPGCLYLPARQFWGRAGASESPGVTLLGHPPFPSWSRAQVT